MPFNQEDLPAHYDRLGAFRDYFATGTPILAYHAIAAPPRGTQFRGLFYEPMKFARQLAELKGASFRSVPLADTIAGPDNSQHQIALTFDDGYLNLFENALQPLGENQFSATVFLVANHLGGTNVWDAAGGVAQVPLMDQTHIRQWLGAGHRIGSHTLTHPHLKRIPAVQAREEIGASKKRLEDMFGVAVEDFCYPYGGWNAAILDFVAEAGYRTACTLSHGLNTAGTPPLELNRLTVRRPTRSWKTLRGWLRRKLAPSR